MFAAVAAEDRGAMFRRVITPSGTYSALVNLSSTAVMRPGGEVLARWAYVVEGRALEVRRFAAYKFLSFDQG